LAVDKNFFDNFNSFVYGYFGVTTTSDNWKGVILEQSFGDEQKALETFFELYDLFIANYKPTNTKKLVLGFLDRLIFEQDEMKKRLGENFSSVLNDTVELIKDHGLSNLKYDYDFIWELLDEKAEEIPDLKQVLIELRTKE
jgi:inhibitor of KinA sporulation pathway (predicted exonuclease)